MGRYTIQNVHTGKYLKTDGTQSSSPYNWNVTARSTVYYLAALRGASQDVFLYLMNKSGNVNLNTYCGYKQLWTQTYYSTPDNYSFQHYQTGNYLVSDDSGVISFPSSLPVGDAGKWNVLSGSGSGIVLQNFAYSSIYLHSDLDGHTVTCQPSDDPASDNLFNWTNATNYSVFLQDATTTTNYLIDSSLSVSVTTLSSPPQSGWTWAWIPSGSNYLFQSVSGGYLKANTDNTSIGETGTGLYPGQTDDYAQWTLTSV